ncbi:MAG TPA: hypothetical protein VGU63_04120, partial [Candidatus Acidoferrales bacterium]|nr:hypothetical protein [Candidatus Acidoferrales bacterium]
MQIRRMMRVTIVPFLLLLSAIPTFAQAPYFPKDAFAGEGRAGTFTTTWYSHALSALNEPSLWQLSTMNKQSTVYRFLWLRTFHHPVCVRVSIAPDGTAEARVKVSSGAGGYDPGHVIEDRTRTLSAIEVSDLLKLVSAANFWQLPTEGQTRGDDGAEWILEGVRNGQYHIVDRWTPTKGAYRDLGLYFIKHVSGLKIPRREIY